MKPVIPAIILFILIFSIMFEFTAFDRTLQKKLIERNSLKENSAEENNQILDFFKTGNMTLNMTASELSHMRDVKKLNDYLKICILVLFVVFGILLYIKPSIMEVLSKLWIPLTASIILFLPCIFFPSQIFSLFHKTFFPQGNYLFPSDSFLISLYPEKYFFELFYAIVLQSVIIIAILILVNIVYKRMVKK